MTWSDVLLWLEAARALPADDEADRRAAAAMRRRAGRLDEPRRISRRTA